MSAFLVEGASMSLWNQLLPAGSGIPLFMGILNLTPDSFSDGGRYQSVEAALSQAQDLVQSGAGLLDLGAESTRPGAREVGPDEEWARLEPVLKALRMALPAVPLSLDTRHAETARRGLAMGVAVLNDVTGFAAPDMLALARDAPCGLIAMRSRAQGDHLWMPPYEGPGDGDPIAELEELRDRLTQAGIAPDRILLDPGFGFGTTYEGDSALWESLPGLPGRLQWPAERFCLGISRKRFLAWRAGTPDLPPQRRDALTAEAHREAMALGFRAFRTHQIEPRGMLRVSPDGPEPLR